MMGVNKLVLYFLFFCKKASEFVFFFFLQILCIFVEIPLFDCRKSVVFSLVFLFSSMTCGSPNFFEC